MRAFMCTYAFMKNDNTQIPTARQAIADDVLQVLDTDFFTALCEPARVGIIRRLITMGACDVKTIAMGLSQDRSVISRHLAVLERAGITASHKAGRRTIYDINGPEVVSKVRDILSVISPMADLCVPFENEHTHSEKGAA